MNGLLRELEHLKIFKDRDEKKGPYLLKGYSCFQNFPQVRSPGHPVWSDRVFLWQKKTPVRSGAGGGHPRPTRTGWSGPVRWPVVPPGRPRPGTGTVPGGGFRLFQVWPCPTPRRRTVVVTDHNLKEKHRLDSTWRHRRIRWNRGLVVL